MRACRCGLPLSPASPPASSLAAQHFLYRGHHAPIRSPKSVPDTVFPSRRAECHDTYPVLVYLTDKVRVIECRDRLQWILHFRRSIIALRSPNPLCRALLPKTPSPTPPPQPCHTPPPPHSPPPL